MNNICGLKFAFHRKSIDMTNIIKCLIIVTDYCFLCACEENTHKQEKEFLTKAIATLEVDKQVYDWIVILPSLGCHGCIQDGEYFMQQNVENPKIFYILTNLSSLKIFQQKTGITIKDHPNIYVDRENLFVVPTNNSIYPCVIQLKEREIAKHTFQSTQTVIFQQLKRHLKENEN